MFEGDTIGILTLFKCPGSLVLLLLDTHLLCNYFAEVHVYHT